MSQLLLKENSTTLVPLPEKPDPHDLWPEDLRAQEEEWGVSRAEMWCDETDASYLISPAVTLKPVLVLQGYFPVIHTFSFVYTEAQITSCCTYL